MKNSMVYLKVLIILCGLLTLILLFPPYTIEKEDYKFFDFVFNPEFVTKQLDKTYFYSLDSRKDKITETDTINAVSVNVKSYTDTIFNYVERIVLPYNKKHPRKGDIYFVYDDETLYKMYPGYYRKDIDYVQNYTITKITKHYYAEGYRKLLLTQLIVEILIVILLTIIITVILIFRNSKKGFSKI